METWKIIVATFLVTATLCLFGLDMLIAQDAEPEAVEEKPIIPFNIEQTIIQPNEIAVGRNVSARWDGEPGTRLVITCPQPLPIVGDAEEVADE